MSYQERVQTFTAINKEGEPHTLHVYQTMVDTRHHGNQNSPPLRGLRSICTDDGGAVNRLDRGKYQIVATDEILTSDDPSAP